MRTLSEFWRYITTTGYQINMIMSDTDTPFIGVSSIEIIPDTKELLYEFIKSYGYKDFGENTQLSILVSGNTISYYYIDLLNWQQKLREQKLNKLLND